MTYNFPPVSEKPDFKIDSYSGATLGLKHNDEEQVCPAVITEFLNKMNWLVACQHPDTQEPLFTKADMGMRPLINAEQEVNLTEGMIFRWYEAVAYEHAKMVSIGLGE